MTHKPSEASMPDPYTRPVLRDRDYLELASREHGWVDSAGYRALQDALDGMDARDFALRLIAAAAGLPKDLDPLDDLDVFVALVRNRLGAAALGSQTLQDAVHNAAAPILEDLETRSAPVANGHHLAQRIAESVARRFTPEDLLLAELAQLRGVRAELLRRLTEEVGVTLSAHHWALLTLEVEFSPLRHKLDERRLGYLQTQLQQALDMVANLEAQVRTLREQAVRTPSEAVSGDIEPSTRVNLTPEAHVWAIREAFERGDPENTNTGYQDTRDDLISVVGAEVLQAAWPP